MINPQWLELSLSRRNSHGPKDVRAIEVRLFYATKKHGIPIVLLPRQKELISQADSRAAKIALRSTRHSPTFFPGSLLPLAFTLHWLRSHSVTIITSIEPPSDLVTFFAVRAHGYFTSRCLSLWRLVCTLVLIFNSTWWLFVLLEHFADEVKNPTRTEHIFVILSYVRIKDKVVNK